MLLNRSFVFRGACISGLLLFVGLASVGIVGCLRGEVFDRRAMLQDLGDVVILPLASSFHQRAKTLKADAEAMCQGPTQATLDTLRTSWRETRLAWRRVAVFRMGPAMENRTKSYVDFLPLKPEGVTAVIEGTDTINRTYLEDTLGSNRRGLAAIEFLIFGEDPAVLEGLKAETIGARRCSFVVAATESILFHAGVFWQAWSVEGGNFVKEMVEAGRDSATFPTLQSPIDQLVNDLYYRAETVVQKRLAEPLGKKAGDTQVFPEQVESPWAQMSRDSISAQIEAIEAALSCQYGGNSGASLFDLLESRGYSALVAQLKTEIKAVRDVSQAIEGSLKEALVSNKAQVEAAYEAWNSLKNTLGTDVTGALGTTLNFTDNDGD